MFLQKYMEFIIKKMNIYTLSNTKNRRTKKENYRKMSLLLNILDLFIILGTALNNANILLTQF